MDGVLFNESMSKLKETEYAPLEAEDVYEESEQPQTRRVKRRRSISIIVLWVQAANLLLISSLYGLWLVVRQKGLGQ